MTDGSASNAGGQGELKLGPVGTEIVFENDTVRVWLVDLKPGDIQALHKHELPYLVIPLTDGENKMRYLSGRVVETHEKPGMALWREIGEPHDLVNTSSWRYKNILVEFKAAVGAKMSDR